MASSSKSTGIGAAATVLVILVIAALAVVTLRHGRRGSQSEGNGCLVRGPGYDVPLTPSQAAIAATIAGVASRRSMPERAVTIAYATAFQESDLQNLPYGDRDSVGVFQQRPSQGWGRRKQLLNPVYATTKFFAALAAVPGYQKMPVAVAAQAVQHSADGSAYGQYAGVGAVMAAAFTGRSARTVWCWYGSGVGKRTHLTAAGQALSAAFGPLGVRQVSHGPAAEVRVHGGASGWAIATWLIAHARGFGISDIRYDGFQWTATSQTGWAVDPPGGKVRGVRGAVVFG